MTLVEADLRQLPEALGEFDYIIAHGVYSWVPPAVRVSLFALAARLLSEHGLVFVSYNVYPGCHVRQAAWEVLRFHSERLQGARERLDAARALAGALAEPGAAQNETDGLRGASSQASPSSRTAPSITTRGSDDPVYLHEFVAHAQRHGIGTCRMPSSSIPRTWASPSMQRLVAGLDRMNGNVPRLRLRRFRQSVLCRSSGRHDAGRAAGMHAAASMSLMNAVAHGKPSINPLQAALDPTDTQRLSTVLERLVAVAPRACRP